MTNDDNYNSYPNCFEAKPIFDDLYCLKLVSPGITMGLNGSNIGLIKAFREIDSKLIIFPNPVNNYAAIFLCKAFRLSIVASLIFCYFIKILSSHTKCIILGRGCEISEDPVW